MSEQESAPETRRGLVVRSTGSWYDVHGDDGEPVRARVRGKFRLEALEIDETNPVAVGDRVAVLMEGDDVGTITAIEPRENQLSRRAAGKRGLVREHVMVANVDRAWCVQSTFGPKVNPGFVDRFLVAAETRHIPAGLILNKADLIGDNERAQEAIAFWRELYEGLGYPVLLTSAETGAGVEAFAAALADRVSVVSGPSGVGKSSLLNAIDPDLDLATSAIGERTQKGRHTTTFATLLRVADGWVADTPGVREWGLWDMAPEELGGYFVEFREVLQHCRFPDCTHAHEPGCAVQDAVDEGSITPERYGSYLAILDTVAETHRQSQEARWRTAGRPDDPDEAVEEVGSAKCEVRSAKCEVRSAKRWRSAARTASGTGTRCPELFHGAPSSPPPLLPSSPPPLLPSSPPPAQNAAVKLAPNARPGVAAVTASRAAPATPPRWPTQPANRDCTRTGPARRRCSRANAASPSGRWRARLAASMSAWAPPCPRSGVIPCAASPTSATRAVAVRPQTGRS